MNPITIFTPTYNRAYCLNKCYESMLRQTCMNFEWLIVDDGSTDNTKDLVDGWINSNPPFKITYVYKENGGMHTAYNCAYKHITTELCMNVDSDDWLTESAIETVLEFWDKNKRSDIGGIYALDQFEDGTVIGSKFPEDLHEFKGWGYKSIFYEVNGIKKRFNNRGDKKFIGVTSVIQNYPEIPVFTGEKYHSLYFKQHLIERDYTILILNKPVCVVEYMPDGSSNNMFFQYIKNPKGFCDERRFVMKYAPTFELKYSSAIHYVADSLLAKDCHYITNSTKPLLTIAATIPGVLLYGVIKIKTRKK